MVSTLQVLKKISAGSFASYKRALPDSSSFPVALDEDPKTTAVVKAFKLQSAAELKVVLSAMILSECVYKLVDVGPADSAKSASTFVSQLPPGLVSLQHMQSVAASVPHRYMLGDDGQSLYVVFMGTKHMRDLLADANFLQEAVWKSKDSDKQQANALAHRGFLARARGIPVEALYAHAKRQGRRLVLCGHSLGGAVALLCALRLLQGLPRGDPSLYCICFGTPAIGNAALAALVAEYGWESHILNFILPEDIIPRILALPPNKVQPASLEQQQQQGTASASAQASMSVPASAQVPITVRNRLQNLRAILTAKTPSMQQLATATDQQARSVDGKPAMQVASIDETLPAASSLLSGNSPGPSDRKNSSQTDSDQESRVEQQSSRLQALRAAFAAGWPPKQQQQPALGSDAEVEQDRTDKTERQSEPATKSQQDEAAVSAAGTGTGVPASPSALFHSLRGRLQRQSAKQAAASEAEPAASSNLDHLVSPPQDGQRSALNPEGTEQIAAEQAQPGKPLFQGIRSFTSRLPGLKRSQPGTLSQALPPDPGTHPNPDSSPYLAQAASADELDSAPQQQQQQGGSDTKQPSTLWGLNRVQGAWEGASSRVKAMRALLPAYPAYVHIGSHQILLPASPAMTEAVKSAQQKGLAEERQQALTMHRMSAYRGRAFAICRSVFHWEPLESATQISLSTTLSPPVTLLHATVIIPPLPQLPSNSSTPAEALTQPASQAVSERQSVQLLVQSDQPLQDLKQQPPTSSGQQHQGGSPQQEKIQQLVDQNVEQLQQKRQPAASAKLPRLGSGTVQLDPDAAPQEQEAPRQAAKHKSPSRQKQREQQLQLVDRPKGSSGAKPDPNLDPKPGRWLPPVGVRWQGKPRPIPRLLVLIRVQGSVHSMPAQAKLQVLGHHWCKAQLISHAAQHSIRQLSMVLSQQLPRQLQPQSWRQKLLRTLPWLTAQAAHDQAQAPQPDVILVQAEVPVTLLQSVVQETELQQRLLQQPAGQQQAPSKDVEAKQGLPIMQHQQQPPAMLLRIETDFVCKEQAVHIQLPVVWVLGEDTRASQAIWQLLTSAKQQSGAHAQQHAGDRSRESDGKKPDSRWQAAQTRLRSALSTTWRQRAPAEQQPQPQLVTAVMSGIQYALIRPTSMRYVDLLSCVLLTLSRLAGDEHTVLSVQQAEAPLQNLPSRIRAAYRMQQLQQLQQQLQELGPPSGVIMLHSGSVDIRSEGALSLIAKQASQMNVMRMGVSVTDHMASEALYGISTDDWIRLPVGAGVVYSEHLQKLQQKLRGSLASVLQNVRRKQSKL